LAGGAFRKRALQSFSITAVIALSAFLWVSHVAPHWMPDWESNLATISAHGGINDPGPASVTSRYGYMVMDLQTVISIFRDDPRIYNPVSYAICGVLLLACMVRTLRSNFTPERAWLALATIAPFTILVTYHRPWDAKLLLLTIPACAMLWAVGGPIRWIAFLVTAAGVVVTADIPLTILVALTRDLRISTGGLPGLMLKAVLMRPAPLVLLAMGIFYLWVYLRREPEKDRL